MVLGNNIILKRMKKVFFILLVTVICVGCKIVGNVTDNGESLKDVTVNLSGTETSTTTTDSDGEFSFDSLDNGEYTVSLSKDGYTFDPESQTVVIESFSDTKTISFVALSNSIPIADPQSIVLIEDSEISILLTGSDSENDPLTYSVITNPEHGLLVGVAPNLMYIPSENYNGSDKFEFIVSDGNNTSEPASINIEVTSENDPPIANDDVFIADKFDYEYKTGNVLENDLDVDGDSLYVQDFTQPTNGTVIYNGDGTFTISVGSDFNGESSFTYTLSDGNDSTDSANIMVKIPPAVSMSASPLSIGAGEQSTLSWASSSASTCSIEPGIGNVTPNGSINVTPQTTTTYTITATNSLTSVASSVTVTVQSPPTVSISADLTTLNPGETSTLTWTSTYADTCTIEPGIGVVDPNGSVTVNPEVTTTYTITALNTDGTATSSVKVTVLNPPTVSIFADPISINSGEQSTLTWTSVNAGTCTIEPNIGNVEPNGSMTVTPQTTTTYTITASNADGSATSSVKITVLSLPEVSFSANPISLNLGESSTLIWTSTNADTCTIEPDVGTVESNGSVIVTPQTTTTYTITASNADGSVTSSVEVTVLSLPTVSISADPTTLNPGETSTLTWTSTNADTCTIEPDIGTVDPNGSVTITPQATTTYTITASNTDGSVTDTIQITVKSSSGVYLNVSESTINYGDSVILTWSAAPALKTYFNNDIGEVSTEGSLTLTPEYTTTYTLTAVNDTQTTNQSISVKVLGHLPEPQPEGGFGEQYNALVPSDASLKSYDPDRFIILTGLVEDISGDPVKDVKIEIIDHPEYGSALTDDTGRFSIPAEGGTLVKLVYTKENLLILHRRIAAPVKDVVTIETVTLLTRDTAETAVTFDGNPDTIITHKSTEYTDESGSRACTLVFSGDNKAYELDQYGNRIRELSSITTRATEYVKPETMPSVLPPNSAFTYCVEMEADGIERIEFDKPVINYVNNFLGFDVGDIVPVGYYDRDIAEWVPSDNGVVVMLLDTNSDGIVDALDADGDDLPDDLNEDGSTLDEVTGLSDAAYKPGDTYWRVNIKHFTPWDHNWPWGPPSDAIRPNPVTIPTIDDENDDDEITCSGSYVENRSRVMNEDIPVMGTDAVLHYSSNRVSDYKTYIDVPVSGDSVPASLKHIIVKCVIAGKVMEKILSPAPNLKTQFEWDGLDYIGNRIRTSISSNIRIGFVYDLVYHASRTNFEKVFAQTGDSPTLIRGRQEIIIWQYNSIKVTPSLFENGIADGWTLSLQHHLFPENLSTLYKGDGNKIQKNLSLISTVAGTGKSGFLGDSGLSTEAQLNYPTGLTIDQQGNLFIADYWNNRIRKVDTSGIITTVAGNGEGGFSGDSGLATEASINKPYGLTIDQQGNLFIADCWNNCIRKVDTNGIITTVAGNGNFSSSGGGDDGVLATEAIIRAPYGLTIDQQGNLYIAEHYRIRKVDTNGIITTVAGVGSVSFLGDGGPATEASIKKPYGLTIDQQGNLYIADSDDNRIRKVDTSGIITTFAGNGYITGISGDGGPAINAQVGEPRDIAIDQQGNLFIIEKYDNIIRKVTSNGIINSVAGGGSVFGDGGPATEAKLNQPLGVAIDQQGNIFFSDMYNHRIRKISNQINLLGDMDYGDTLFADKNGLGYIMSSTGKHKKTISLDTGKTLKTFEYGVFNDAKHLISITDQFGNTITINRDTDGTATSIISPDGLETLLSIGNNNHLESITSPDDSIYNFTYSSGGLLTEKIEPNLNTFHYVYNGIGRLTETYNEAGGHWFFNRFFSENGSMTNTVTSGEGNTTIYEDYIYSTGKYSSEITDPTGGKTYYTQSEDELSAQKSLSCGMELDYKYGVDPEFKYKFIKEITKTTPSGLASITQQGVTYEDTNSDEKPDLITRSISVNGKTSILENNVLSSTKTITTPEGRQASLNYDPDTLVVTNYSIPGFTQTDYTYDSTGRIETVTAGTREASFTYDSNGYLESVTNPLNQTVNYTNDKAGRVTYVDRPDGSTLEFSYDENGNMTMFTNPGSIDHTFGYNKVSRKDSYDTPLSGSYSYIYDKDRRQIQKNFPSGSSIYWDYTDPANPSDKSRLQQVVTPEGVIDISYLCTSKVGSINKGSETITYDYDGSLITSESLSGVLNQTLFLTYNTDFNVETFTYVGETEAFTYDNDGLLTAFGNYTISRNADNGLPVSFTDNTLTLNRTFSGYGELTNQTVNVNSNDLFAYDLIYNDNGQITNKTETVDGVSSNYIYTYDTMGRLLTATIDGALVEEYRYDLIGTRNYEMNTLRGIPGRTFTYSDEDHLLTAGGNAYQYNADGFLTSKTVGSETTTYDYSSRGELLNVVLPDSRNIVYEHDPRGRRIAKKIDGVTTEKYLWAGFTTLLAVFDGSDNIISRFEYADSRMPVSMMKEGVRYYLIYNQIGSLKLVADGAGNIVKQIDYDSFGNMIDDTNPAFTVPFGFAGGLHDMDTGLVRFGYRDYDTDIGRWTAKDPIGFAGGDSDLYGYVLNDPINFMDPLGLKIKWGQVVGGTGQVIGGIFTMAGGIAIAGGSSGFAAPLGVLVGGIGAGEAQIGFLNMMSGFGFIDADIKIPSGPCRVIGEITDNEIAADVGQVFDFVFDTTSLLKGNPKSVLGVIEIGANAINVVNDVNIANDVGDID